jgi:hypothetical protein
MKVKDRITRWLDTTDTTQSPLSLRNLNFYIDNNVLYSYGDHWPLAYRYRTVKGIDEKSGTPVHGWSMIINTNNYSGQTSMTRGHIYDALDQSKVNYEVFEIGGRQQHGKAYTPCNCRLMFAMIPHLARHKSRHYEGNDSFMGSRTWTHEVPMLSWKHEDNEKLRAYKHTATVANEINRLQLSCLFADVLGKKNTPYQKKQQALGIADQPLKALLDMYRALYMYDKMPYTIQRLLKEDNNTMDTLYDAWLSYKAGEFNDAENSIFRYYMTINFVDDKAMEKHHMVQLLKQSA